MTQARNPWAWTTRVCVVALILTTSAMAAVVPERDSRFEDLIIYEPVSTMGQLGDDPEVTSGLEDERQQWREFKSVHGQWSTRIDRRSGVPMSVRGEGIPWFTEGEAITVEALESKAREFVGANRLLLKVRESELVLRTEGSGAWDKNHHIALFSRTVNGIPVEGQNFRLLVSHGNLVAFGADRWGPTPRTPNVSIDQAAALRILYDYMGLEENDFVETIVEPQLQWTSIPGGEEFDRRFTGVVGQGAKFALTWKFVLRVNGAIETWVGKVDSVTSQVIAFYDDTQYAQVKGGVLPVSYDGACPDGCEQPDYPMPYLDVDIDGVVTTTNDTGIFECTPGGGNASTVLSGPYVRVNDRCGAISESVTCDNDLDLGISPGTDCAVPTGASPGNTHSARGCYYHINRLKDKMRTWLPSIGFWDLQTVCDVNIDSNCNATYGGNELNMYTSGGGCGNTGETAGVVHHEYGHGIDQNDGGGSDSPSDGYADVVAILMERRSCVGRGFKQSGTCSGYGDTCLTCTGIRDMDWGARQANTPATPANFIAPNCGGGGAPCGREQHCEGYVGGEAVYDLAARDLQTWGLDADSAWQLGERLWFSSRLGSGGNAWNCTLPDSDGCGAGNWFMEVMTLDDDDGNLANGTPHASAIFAAFDRHAIACGAASDPENTDSGSCPTLTAPTLTANPGSGTVSLNWTDVVGANEYRVLRTEIACTDYSMNLVDTITAPTLAYDDTDLPNGFDFHYRVQAIGANTSCESPVSNCITTAPQAFDGSIKFDNAQHRCTNTVDLTVTDANVGASTLDVIVFSDSEPTPETVTLTETSPGSAKYVGSIQATTSASINGDGMLELSHFDNLTSEYVDADDGEGGSGITKFAASAADCVDLVRTSLTVNDSAGGNSDGILDPGEWVDLPLEIQNIGDDVATNVVVQVESLSPFAEVRVAGANLPDMPGSTLASTMAGGHLQIRLTSDLPCTEPVAVRFSYLADNEAVTQDDSFPTGTKVTVELDDFEGATTWQHIAAESTATTGDWLVGDPDGTDSQPEDDTTANPGSLCLFTQPNPGGLGTDDIDDGAVVARSGSFDFSAFPDVHVSLNRWFSNRDTGEDTGDFWRLEVRESAASADVLLEELDTNQNATFWQEVEFRLGDFITSLNEVSLKVTAADGPATGNLVEAAIDDVRFWNPTCTTHDPAPNSVLTLGVDRNLGDLDLTWQRPVLDPTHGETVRYRVYRSLFVDNGFSELQLINDSADSIGWTDAGAGGAAPSFYAYLVVSENDSGTSEPPPAP